MCLVVDDFDHDGQVCGQFDETGRVDDAVGAKARDAVHDCGTRETVGPEPLEERTRERRVTPPIRLAEEDANEELIAVQNAHGSPSLQRPSSSRAATRPSHPAMKPPITVRPRFMNAVIAAPSSNRRIVS